MTRTVLAGIRRGRLPRSDVSHSGGGCVSAAARIEAGHRFAPTPHAAAATGEYRSFITATRIRCGRGEGSDFHPVRCASCCRANPNYSRWMHIKSIWTVGICCRNFFMRRRYGRGRHHASLQSFPLLLILFVPLDLLHAWMFVRVDSHPSVGEGQSARPTCSFYHSSDLCLTVNNTCAIAVELIFFLCSS